MKLAENVSFIETVYTTGMGRTTSMATSSARRIMPVLDSACATTDFALKWPKLVVEKVSEVWQMCT